MKAMILAAGLGTRLRPLTDDRPKALVTLGGRTLLEIALARLCAAGVREVIVNTHHHAEMIRCYLKANDHFGMRIEVSHEPELLDTGGGLKKAARFFLESGEEPFLVHNVDVVSAIDLRQMLRFHAEQNALATLAVQQRSSSRWLLFSGQNLLCGRRRGPEETNEWARQTEQVQPLAFCGIHVLSPRIFARMKEEGAFSIIDAYLRLAAQGERIAAFRADGAYWRDLGRPESIAAAEEDLANGLYAASFPSSQNAPCGPDSRPPARSGI
ncbi:MAG: nucleotidyltransferase family protein [Terracidiphilus sp.]